MARGFAEHEGCRAPPLSVTTTRACCCSDANRYTQAGAGESCVAADAVLADTKRASGATSRAAWATGPASDGALLPLALSPAAASPSP